MAHKRCAVLGCDKSVAGHLGEVLIEAGYDRPQYSEDVRVARMGRYSPRVLLIDFDHLRSDKLESTRQLRFVLPNCAIAVVSSNSQHDWARQCHMAGANGVLSSGSSVQQMVVGVRIADSTGCYTDPAFVPMQNG